MSWADRSIEDSGQKNFSFARSVINSIGPPNADGRGRTERTRTQLLTRHLMQTEACRSLNSIVLHYKATPEHKSALYSRKSNAELYIILEGIELDICAKLRHQYIKQFRALSAIEHYPPEVNDFLNLYTAALMNAVKTYASLTRLAISKLDERNIPVPEIFSSNGIALLRNNQHLAHELSRLPLPVFNLFLNNNGGNIPVGTQPYRFDKRNFMIAELSGSYYLLPTEEHLKIFARIANSPETIIQKYGRSGEIEVENFRASYSASAMGCPAFKRAVDHGLDSELPTVGLSFISNMNRIFCESLELIK